MLSESSHPDMLNSENPQKEGEGELYGAPIVNNDGGARTFKICSSFLILAALGLLAIGCNKSAAPAGKSGGQKAPQGPVAVVMGKVAQKDVPIYRDGLGTVQAFNTVTVRSRVDGQLQKLGFTEGQDVKTGDVLAQIDPAPFQTQVAQAEAKKAQDEAQLVFAQVELKRDAELLSSKILTQEAYDTQKAQVNQLDAAVKADQAAIDSARVQLNYTTIAAPIDGRTGIRFVDEGNIIRSADSNGVVVLTQLKPISVIFTLPEQTLGEIQQQFSAGEMTVLAVDRDNSTTLAQGKLAVVDNQIDPTTGTIRLKSTFPNENLRLWPGQFVNARLLLKTRKDGSVVPASVVQRGPEGAYAFVVGEDNAAQMRKVTVGQIDRGEALIDEGLQPGERVVVDGQYKLQPGAKVKEAEASTASGPPPAQKNGRPRADAKSGKKKKAEGSD